MITSLDQLVTALGAAQSLPFRKQSLAMPAFGVASLWGAAGVPGPGANPVDIDGVFPGALTQGALRFMPPISGATTQIGRAAATCSSVVQILIYDRIWHGKVNVTSTSVQAIDWPTIGQRYADGAGVELWAEVSEELVSTTPGTWTAEIVDQDGHPVIATAAYDGDGSVGRMIPFDVEESLGVQRVESIQLSASLGGGGLNLVLVRRLAELGISQAGVGVVSSGTELGLPPIEDNACLALMAALGDAEESGALIGRLELVQG